jgi:hypothetical protein
MYPTFLEVPNIFHSPAVDWSARGETPAGEASQRETPQAQSAEEAPGPPAESEPLERKSTGGFERNEKS